MHLQKPVMVSFVLAVLIGFCGPAFAHCAANEETVIDCAIGDKRLSLCVASDATLIYSFENKKAIELRRLCGLEILLIIREHDYGKVSVYNSDQSTYM